MLKTKRKSLPECSEKNLVLPVQNNAASEFLTKYQAMAYCQHLVDIYPLTNTVYHRRLRLHILKHIFVSTFERDHFTIGFATKL